MTVVLIAIVSFELVSSVFVADPLARVAETIPLSGNATPVLLLILSVAALIMLIWFQSRSAKSGQNNTE